MLKAFYKKVKNPKFEKHDCQILLPLETSSFTTRTIIISNCYYIWANSQSLAVFPKGMFKVSSNICKIVKQIVHQSNILALAMRIMRSSSLQALYFTLKHWKEIPKQVLLRALETEETYVYVSTVTLSIQHLLLN